MTDKANIEDIMLYWSGRERHAGADREGPVKHEKTMVYYLVFIVLYLMLALRAGMTTFSGGDFSPLLPASRHGAGLRRAGEVGPVRAVHAAVPTGHRPVEISSGPAVCAAAFF
jgi:hypothetical protein